jgi:hypothetical protein
MPGRSGKAARLAGSICPGWQTAWIGWRGMSKPAEVILGRIRLDGDVRLASGKNFSPLPGSRHGVVHSWQV